MKGFALVILCAVVTQLAVAQEPYCGPDDDFFAAAPDCAWFYACRNGIVELLPCPSGTLWNQNIDRCDAEANVVCPGEATPAPPPSPTPAPTVPGPVTTSDPSATSPPVTFMPDVEGALPILFPPSECPSGIKAFLVHESNCRRYFYCLYGMRHAQVCPFMHKFDFMRGHCVPEDDAALRCFADID
ncbi:peritrophin-1-like [Anopheles bellator]|uniref:peritrophin-1-like n=1 Tax=Anopheles bellator TaxID=139047 RepID=UPI00264932D8|nr:peritrophin-1-like [Anopheles bellator]